MMPNPTCSIDIFDTLLTRSVARPSDVFILVAERARSECKDYTEFLSIFPVVRMRSEIKCRRKCSSKETTIDLIYEEVRLSNDLPLDVVSKLKQLELDIELENCILLHENVTNLKKRGVKFDGAVLLTDMYLPRETIVAMLAKCDLFFAEERIIISHEINASKANGGAYKVLKKRFGSITCHYGDNLHADVKMAKKHGLEAHQIVSKNNQITSKIKANIKTRSFGEVVVQKCIREVILLSNNRLELSENQILAVKNFAPVLLLCAFKILQVLRETKTAKIAFASRDGYYVYRVFTILCSYLKVEEIDCNYIFLSRSSLRSLTEYIEHRDQESSRDTGIVDLKAELESLNLGEVLSESFIFDIGWNGTVQKAFQEFKVRGAIPGDWFKSGIYLHVSNIFPEKKLSHFSLSKIFGDFKFQLCLESERVPPEWFLRAPHGGVVGYISEDHRKRPRLAPQRKQERREIKAIGDAYITFAKAFIEEVSRNGAVLDLVISSVQKPVLQNYFNFIFFPSVDEAQAFSASDHNCDASHVNFSQVVGRTNLMEIFCSRNTRIAKKTGWPSASLALMFSGEILRIAQFVYLLRCIFIYHVKKALKYFRSLA